MAGLSSWFNYFSGLADKLEGSTVPLANPSYFAYTRKEPVGVVGAITPWNSPLLLLTWKLAPLLAAGTVCVAKPSEHSPASTVAFAQILHEAGLPAGVFNVVTGWDRSTGEALSRHRGIDKVAFTGSTATGIAVARAAVENVNRVTLELGGKSAQTVFPDADLDAAANGIVAGVFAATGQTCMAGSRLVVHESVADELVAKVVARAQTIQLGDPKDPATEMGPVANRPQYDKVLGYLRIAAEEGGTFAAGGAAASELGGLFVQPTVITGVSPESTVVREEIFGPVLSVLTFRTPAEAVEKANNTPYGLSAGVWTDKGSRILWMADQLRAGVVWANTFNKFDPTSPFGGYKESGYGREGGRHGLEGYLK
jgi:aldehyde dehydrogenase (NAD+)